jgi:beta-1,4-N-acetylglucosaminyltransferase
MIRYAFIALLSLLAVVFVRAASVLLEIRRRRKILTALTPRAASVKTLIVLGSGGHTTEMLMLTKHLDPKHYFPIEYCKASTDTTSSMRLNRGDVVVHNIPRSREVGQSYVTSILTSLHALIYAFLLVARVRPQLIICNGPGTAMPICVAGLFFRILGYCESQVVFVESYCRVETLSLTGKLLYLWADVFVVHWEELHRRYPNSGLVNTFVRR